MRERPVGGEDQADCAGLTHPFNTLCDRGATTEPIQIWGLATITSSTGLVMKEDNSIAVNHAAAARAIATSRMDQPPGHWSAK